MNNGEICFLGRFASFFNNSWWMFFVSSTAFRVDQKREIVCLMKNTIPFEDVKRKMPMMEKNNFHLHSLSFALSKGRPFLV
jgi:hypothetical protein